METWQVVVLSLVWGVGFAIFMFLVFLGTQLIFL